MESGLVFKADRCADECVDQDEGGDGADTFLCGTADDGISIRAARRRTTFVISLPEGRRLRRSFSTASRSKTGRAVVRVPGGAEVCGIAPVVAIRGVGAVPPG